MIYILYDTALNGLYTLMLLQKAYPGNQSLFKGTKDENLSDVAPYIFSVEDKLFEKISDPFASMKEMVVVESDEKINNLTVHFQEFIYQKIKGQENYFRFWDARVLQRFLPASTDKELNSFFDGIKNYYVLDRVNATAKRFCIKRGKLQADVISLNKLFNPGNEEELEMEHETSTENAEPKKTKRNFFK
jgi:hypothetical protein